MHRLNHLAALIVITTLLTAGSARSDCQDGWTYIEVDDSRAAWGDFDPPSWLRYFGLGWGDVSGDGMLDLVSGRYFYRNPGGDMSGSWERVDFGSNIDGLLILYVDGDAFGDIIATRGSTVYWLEADDTAGSSWTSTTIDTNAPTENHVNPQGYALADLNPGGRPEIVLANGGVIFYYTIPDNNPEAGNWPRTQIVANSNSEGFGIGDIDGDGLPDIAAAHFPPNAGFVGPRDIKWARNPGDGSGDWTEYIIGSFPDAWPDRMAVADLNGDQRPDIVVTEETSEDNADTYWFEAPPDPTDPWTRHHLVKQGSTNSMDVADIDRDGDIDIILAEHCSSTNSEKLAIWQNNGSSEFTEIVVDTGKEGHLGARVVDLDQDGDLEIVNIAWDDYQFLHLWRNDDCGSPAHPADLDMDGDVDTADIDLFRDCSTGPTVTYDPQNLPAGCTLSVDQGILLSDFDRDGDVDVVDFSRLQRCLTPAGSAPDPDCMN